jgi:CheY-like chemotaxis protein/nitrogen-specific signal transduction histidine kinase
VLDVLRADGARLTAFAKATPLLSDCGVVSGAVGAFLDITRLKQAEDALRDADRRKDEFLAMLAHELRNPLAPIRTGLDILLGGAENAKSAQLLKTMTRQVDHLVRLVDDLLEVSRFSRGLIHLHKERVDLAQVVSDAVASSQTLIAKRRHVLTVSPASEPLPLDADPTRVVQVATSLLNNAAKFTRPGGLIAITTLRQESDAVMIVRDNGAGIPCDKLNFVFDLFAQLDSDFHPPGGGLGIGLAMVQRLVTMHGGSVEARSEGLGRGSEFIVRLPLAKDFVDRVLDQTREKAETKSARRRVLVVDDIAEIADIFAMLLESFEVDVRVAYNGVSALEILAEFKPEIVFLDIGMPVMDGCEVARRIRQLPGGRDIFLVAVTGWGQDGDRLRTSEAGFDKHLVKPVDSDQVQAVLAVKIP